MKGFKKIISLIVSFALVVGVLFSISVESKADDVPSGFIKEGDTVTISRDFPAGALSPTDIEINENDHLIVSSVKAYEISSSNWEYALVIYFYKFKRSLDEVESLHSYIIHNDGGAIYLDRDVSVTDDAECIECYLNVIKSDNQLDIQNKINTGYSMRWDTPISIPGPAPETHNWQHGVIYPASETAEGLEGDYCTECGATRNTTPIPCTYVIMDNRVQQIDIATPTNTNILEMKTLCSLPNYFMKMIDRKKDCDFVLRFTYNKKHYEVFIPAGTQFDNTLEWYGPEKLLSMFEYKELY